MSGPQEGSPQDDLSTVARMAPIIVGSLLFGTSSLLAFAVLLRSTGREVMFSDRPWDVLPPKGLLTLIGLVFASMMVVLSFVVPGALVANMRKAILLAKTRQCPGGRAPWMMNFYSVYNSTMIVGLVLLESATFFNEIALLLEGPHPEPESPPVALVAAGARLLVPDAGGHRVLGRRPGSHPPRRGALVLTWRSRTTGRS